MDTSGTWLVIHCKYKFLCLSCILCIRVIMNSNICTIVPLKLVTVKPVTSIVVLWSFVIILHVSSLLRSPESAFTFSSNEACLPSKILLNVTPDMSCIDKRNKKTQHVYDQSARKQCHHKYKTYHFSSLKYIHISALIEFYFIHCV